MIDISVKSLIFEGVKCLKETCLLKKLKLWHYLLTLISLKPVHSIIFFPWNTKGEVHVPKKHHKSTLYDFWSRTITLCENQTKISY